MARTMITYKQLTLLKQSSGVKVSQDKDGNSLIYRPCSSVAMLLDPSNKLVEVDGKNTIGDKFDPTNECQQGIIQFILKPINKEE